MSIKVKCIAGLLVYLAVLVSVSCQKKETDLSSAVKWPKNVEIVVPAGAGGDSDYNARLFANGLSQKLPPNFVVSNVNGNGGATGTRQVKNASNDGSSILFYHSAFVVNQLSGTTDYGFDSYEFACIPAASSGNVVTVRADSGIKTLKELYDYTQANPGKLKIAAQTGATTYAIAALMKQAGFNVNIVDAGSAADRLAALLGGHVDIIQASYGIIKDYISEGELVPLAMDGENDLNSIKSMINEGYNIKLPFYYFFAFPKGTDQALVNEFCAAVKEIVETDEKYAQSISETYYQVPTYYNAQDGLAKFNEVYKILGNVDFKGN
ncbi:MAG: tripartite tricarboxylate transporter substrate binding protein [Treponema sp.]|jgi:tripartite-type tricarboxylate transporter receptor subunit TctC|nr:tripartite tricarboxylate transporter substrate binding protein [Treponema sp.]